MTIKDDDGVNVFVSVDRHSEGRGFVFQYTSRHERLAPMMIRGLLPYLKAKLDPSFREQLLKCFTLEAVKKSMSYEWDEAKRCVVSAADKRVDDLLECWDMDEEFEFPDTDTKMFELDISVLKRAQEQATTEDLFGGGIKGVNPHDEDSVSTMVDRHSEPKVAGQKKGGVKSKLKLGETQRSEKKTTNKTKKINENKDDMDKAAVAAAITGKIQELQMELARALMVPSSSLQPGQAEEELSSVGDGDVSGSRSA